MCCSGSTGHTETSCDEAFVVDSNHSPYSIADHIAILKEGMTREIGGEVYKVFDIDAFISDDEDDSYEEDEHVTEPVGAVQVEESPYQRPPAESDGHSCRAVDMGDEISDTEQARVNGGSPSGSSLDDLVETVQADMNTATPCRSTSAWHRVVSGYNYRSRPQGAVGQNYF